MRGDGASYGKERRKICWTFDISAFDLASVCIRIRLSSSFHHFQCPPDSRFSTDFWAAVGGSRTRRRRWREEGEAVSISSRRLILSVLHFRHPHPPSESVSPSTADDFPSLRLNKECAVSKSCRPSSFPVLDVGVSTLPLLSRVAWKPRPFLGVYTRLSTSMLHQQKCRSAHYHSK